MIRFPIAALGTAIFLAGCGQQNAGERRAQEHLDGRRVVQAKCSVCHSTKPGINRNGPSLAGIVGRRIGGTDGYAYSDVLQASDGVWDEQSLDAFLAGPRQMFPGTRMVMGGIESADERAAIVAFLKTI